MTEQASQPSKGLNFFIRRRRARHNPNPTLTARPSRRQACSSAFSDRRARSRASRPAAGRPDVPPFLVIGRNYAFDAEAIALNLAGPHS